MTLSSTLFRGRSRPGRLPLALVCGTLFALLAGGALAQPPAPGRPAPGLAKAAPGQTPKLKKKKKAKLPPANLSLAMLAAAQFNFSPSGLQGASLTNPTSLQFGPDNRLYVSEQGGLIKAFTVVRNAANSYAATATETINLINQIPNHDDNGQVNPGVTTRQITGILVKGTAASPVLYVSSSDSRIGGPSGKTALDTNSGIVSQLTRVGGGWTKVDLVRGLPRSEENHSVNGMQLDPTTNTLYLAVGGHTNAGAPSTNFNYACEYALSAAILSLNLTALNALATKGSGNTAYKYDLPTLDDPTRPNNPDGSDPFDPFGGNVGLNQAKIVPGGPVQVYSPGFRNPYDLVITQARKMYTIDNGANQGWGGYPTGEGTANALNDYPVGEPGSTAPTATEGTINNLDNFHYIGSLDSYVPGSYYGGHPAPTRANPAGAGLYTFTGTAGVFRTSPTGPNPLPADWPPVAAANPIEGDFQMPGSAKSGARLTFTASTNGTAEYTASNFNGALKGSLLACGYDGSVVRIGLTADGTNVTNQLDPATKLNQDLPFASGFGSTPLDITVQGDNDIFPGSVWAATYGGNAITIFEPQDFLTCTGKYDANDDDQDGYTNADEIDNATQPCSAASVPPDADHDFVSDLNDPDDDNDGIADTVDCFALDAANGLATILPVKYDLFNNSPGTGLYGLGFTGLMVNKDSVYSDLFFDQNLIAGGTAGAFTIVNVAPSDALGTRNTQENAFQFGVKASPAAFTVQGRLLGTFFNGQTPQNFQSQGIYLGNGDQDNYLKVALTANGGLGGLEVVYENAGVPAVAQYPLPGGIPASTLDFFLAVNPVTGTVQPKYAADGGAITNLGSPVQVSGALLAALQDGKAYAVGIIATSRGASPFTATWDFIYVTTDQTGPNAPPTVVNPIPDQTATVGTAFSYAFPATTFSDPNNDPLSYLATQADGSALPAWLSFNGFARTFSGTPPPPGPTTPASYSVKVKANDGRSGVVSDIFILSISSVAGTAVYRLNAGGGALSTSLGAFGADQGFSPAPGYTFATTAAIAGTSDDALYQTERSAPTNQGTFAYALPLTNGTYAVVLHFAEIYWSSAGQRRFDVSIEGTKVLDNYDIVQKAGAFTATTETFTATVSDGVLDVYLSALAADGGVDRPKLAAIEVFSTGPASTAPGASAGPDQVLTQPASSTTLAGQGTAASGRSITAYAWSQVGTTPALAAFSSKTVAAPTISGLTATGTYTFSLVVTDNTGASSTADQIIVTVNPAPVAGSVLYRINAGGGQVANTIGTFAADNAFAPAPGTVFTTTAAINGPADGGAIYKSERYGATFGYTVPVTSGQQYKVVLHFAEIYFTGVGQRVFDVSLEGTKVLDNYDIVKKVGAFTATTETFTVTVADNALNLNFSSLASDGGTDNAKIAAFEVYSLGPGPNPVPVANAGPDQIVTLPTNSVSLAGSGTDDGTIKTYAWSQASGPAGAAPATLSGAATATPTASGLVAGTYLFNLVVTDNLDQPSAPDQVQVTVNAAPTASPPVATAGPNQVLTQPASSTTLAGQGTASAGRSITAYAWSQVGTTPALAAFSSKTVAAPTISGLTATGTYTFSLVVTDNTGARSAASQVTVTVNAAPAAGQSVVSFTLINADTEQPIRTLTAGEVLNLATLPTHNLNVRANTNPATVGSVKFALSGAQVQNRTETSAPYALFGDAGGNYNAWIPPVGSYSLTARPYTGGNGNGTAGAALTLAFSVVNQAALTGGRATAPALLAAPTPAGRATAATEPAEVYPNPSATGRFRLRLPAAFGGRLHYVLVSAVGATVARGELPGTGAARLLDVDFSREMTAAGVYYLLLQTSHAQAQLRLLKE